MNEPDVRTTLRDQFLPPEMGEELLRDAGNKINYSIIKVLILSFLCTPFLAYATSLSALLVSQGWPTAAAGLVFPVGYVMLAMLGLEMVTGTFSVMPIGVFGGVVRPAQLIRNWFWTYLGNLTGGIFFAWLLWFSLTRGGEAPPNDLLKTLASVAEKKATYQLYGVKGWLGAVGMGILCNWLVSLAPVFAKASRSVSGKIMLMWLPIATFFALGFEHAVVNMFVFPAGILSGAELSVQTWWIWNQIPVTIGNIAGAVIFNAVLWFLAYNRLK